jgi:hypothetical protein
MRTSRYIHLALSVLAIVSAFGTFLGSSSAGAPTVPPGSRGSGDVPSEPGDSAVPPVDCDADDDGATELGELTCAPSNWGSNCHGACLNYKALCYPAVENYMTKRQNVLWKCCNCDPGRCWYIDRTNPKSGCSSPTGVALAPLCWGK